MPKRPSLLPAHAPFYSPAAIKARDAAVEADPLSPLDLLLLGFGPGGRAMSLASKAGPRVATYAGAMARGARMAMTAGLVNDLSHGRNPGAAAPFNAAAGAALGPPAELIAAAITGLGENVASRFAPRFRQGSYAEVLPGSAPLTESTPGALRPFSQGLLPPAATRALPPASPRLPAAPIWASRLGSPMSAESFRYHQLSNVWDEEKYLYFMHENPNLAIAPSMFGNGDVDGKALKDALSGLTVGGIAYSAFPNPHDANRAFNQMGHPEDVPRHLYRVMPDQVRRVANSYNWPTDPAYDSYGNNGLMPSHFIKEPFSPAVYMPLPAARPVPVERVDVEMNPPKPDVSPATIKRLKRTAQRGTPWRTMWLDMLAKGDRPYFHGTNSPVANFDPNFFSPGNLFGSGFYQTDSPKIAESYGPNVFLTKRTSRAPYINLERPFTPASALWQALNRSGILNIWDTHGKTPAEVQKSIGGHDWMNGYAPTPTGRDILDNFRASERTKEYDAMLGQLAEFMATTNDGGRRYAGFTHLGGQYRGNREHNVRINWRPDLDLTMRPITLTGPDTPIPQHTYLSPAMQEYFDRNRTLASILYGVPVNELLPKRQPR